MALLATHVSWALGWDRSCQDEQLHLLTWTLCTLAHGQRKNMLVQGKRSRLGCTSPMLLSKLGEPQCRSEANKMMCAPGGTSIRPSHKASNQRRPCEAECASRCSESRIADRHVGSRARGAHERLLLLMRTMLMAGQFRGGMVPVSMLLERSAICTTDPR